MNPGDILVRTAKGGMDGPALPGQRLKIGQMKVNKVGAGGGRVQYFLFHVIASLSDFSAAVRCF